MSHQQQVIVSLFSPSCVCLSHPPQLPPSPGSFCILLLCNASLQLRQAGSSVFLLHRSAAGGRERENMFCVCVCVSLAVLCCHGNGGHMAQAAFRPSTARVVLQEASFSLKWRNAYRHTNTVLRVIWRMADGPTGSQMNTSGLCTAVLPP